MESFNLGAVLLALLIVLWLAYVVPRTAQRRAEMGKAMTARTRRASSPAARDLSDAAHRHRTPPEETIAMAQPRPLLRPADPTRRPRFEDEPGSRIDTRLEQDRQRGALRAALIVLGLLTAAVIALVVLGAIPWWSIALVGLADVAYVGGLRRAELQRRQRRAALARRIAGSAGAPVSDPSRTLAPEAPLSTPPAPALPQEPDLDERIVEAADAVSRAGEWTPVPVPRPAYALRGDVEDLATRHAVHRETVIGRSVPLEREQDAPDEALTENPARREPAGLDLRLDEILERRRA
ncbi:hypothetical protein [Brachybacterium hainanense]|uniref:Large exoprotein n=1 Tax=Brachybacterium hainanense TaxID=1541174 RepID=A0ABV6REK7_9MICO